MKILNNNLNAKSSLDSLANAMMCLGATLVGAIAVVSAEPVQAQLQVCNRTNRTVDIAVGYGMSGGWSSQGWYEVGAKQCEVVLNESLIVDGYYYLYGSDRSDNWVWEGANNQDFCVHPTDKFNYLNKKEVCGGKGTEWRSFFEVKVDSSNYTMNLTN